MFITVDRPRHGGEREESTMTAQQHLAFGIVEGRAHPDRDLVLVRHAELATEDLRRRRRVRRLLGL